MVARRPLPFVLACLVVTGTAAVAIADSPKLAQARSAIAAVRYDDAQALLVGALQDGGNSPAAIAEIYRLSARSAVVLDQRDLAEQYYRRWLAIDPSASLPDSVAPKLREPFVSAQAYMNAHGRLSARATRTSDREVEVVIVTDPLEMAMSVAFDGGGTKAPIRISEDRRATLEVPEGAMVDRVFVLDEFGNRLAELVVGANSVARLPRGSASPGRPGVLRSPTLWIVGAGALVGTGVAFGLLANRADRDLGAITDDPSSHFYGDAQVARDARDRDALIANIAFAAGGVCAATAILMYVTRPHEPPPVVTPLATERAVGLAWSGRF